MLYLLDANVLITARNSYYPIDRVPEFWGWLAHVCSEEHAKVPLELYEEITDGNDALSDWARDDDNRSALLLEEPIDSGWFRGWWNKAMLPTSPTTSLRKSAGIHS